MKITSLRANHFTEPVGFDLADLSLSWIPESEKAQRALWSRVEIATDAKFRNVVSDSGETQLDSLSYQPKIALAPRTRYFWRVTVQADNGERTTASSFFETGKMDEAWVGRWITKADAKEAGHFLARKRFSAKKGVSCRLYAGVLGVYEAEVNGVKITDEVLVPGYHFYPYGIYAQAYDISKFVKEGQNEVVFHVGRGWYGSVMGAWVTQAEPFGDTPAVIAEIRADGKVAAKTDATWEVAPSPVTASSIYYGEDYDARRAALSAKDWKKAVVFTPPEKGVGKLIDRLNPPVRVTEVVPATKIITTPKGETVVDFGQEMTGWVEVFNRAPAGAAWSFEAGEMFDADGNFFRENLRSARARFDFVSDGKASWVRQHFTFFGFRYIRLTGFGKVSTKDFRGLVIHSDIGFTGDIKTANPKLDRFFLNTLWGQRGNFLDIPSDCPQRDERLGWTGDAGAFCSTASFNMYTPAFFWKYIRDMQVEQPDYGGGVPYVIPQCNQWWKDLTCHSSAAWGDAATIIPWNIYTWFGDTSLLRKMYPSMKMWVGYIKARDAESGGRHLWTTGFHFADWLALDNFRQPLSCIGGTDCYYVASAYYAWSTELTLRAAEVLGEFADAEQLRADLAAIKEAFAAEYFSPNGRCVVDTQTAYVIALAMDLVPESYRARCAAILAAKVADPGGTPPIASCCEDTEGKLAKPDKCRLESGFVGTQFLCRVLANNGYEGLAYKLLLREEYPSWLYEVNYGATTVWERWNGQGPASRPEDMGMNSFNHYAYGSIEEFVYRDVCGLNPDPLKPGFRHAVLRPHPSAELGAAHCRYQSACGLYEAGWKYGKGGKVSYNFRVPFGCTATLVLPGQQPREIGPGLHRF